FEGDVDLAVEAPAALDRLDRHAGREQAEAAAELERVPGRAEAAEPGARPLADPVGARQERGADAAEAGPDLYHRRAVEAALVARRELGAVPARRQGPLETPGERARVAAARAAGKDGHGAARPDGSARIGEDEPAVGRRRDRAREPRRRREQDQPGEHA